MRTDRKPQIVVITGAGAGVGRATAREFAKSGCCIGLIARDRGRLEQTAAEVRELGGQAVVCVADVADAAQVETAAVAIEAAFGPFDVWVNDAMATIYSPFRKISAEDYKRATEVTYLGAVYGTMAALKRMKQNESWRYRPGRVRSRLSCDSASISPIAVQNLRFEDSLTRCAANCCMTVARFA